MPTNVHIRYEDCGCGSKPCITVSKPLVRIHPIDKTIKFHNQLQASDPPDSYLEIHFYDADDKGGVPLTDFCGPGSGDKLTVNKSKWEACEIDYSPADYAYTVQSVGYVPLDPIIIIEPESKSYGLSPLVALVALAVVGAGAFLFGRSRSRGSG